VSNPLNVRRRLKRQWPSDLKDQREEEEEEEEEEERHAQHNAQYIQENHQWMIAPHKCFLTTYLLIAPFVE
jgi:hypothetical protein